MGVAFGAMTAAFDSSEVGTGPMAASNSPLFSLSIIWSHPYDPILGLGARSGTVMRFGLTALSWRTFCVRTFTVAVAISFLLVTLGQSQAADPAPKRVLMLQSFGFRFAPRTDFAELFRSN